MKKVCLVLLSVFLLLLTACDSWMQDDDFYSEIENDVKVANAQQISVYVRYALTRQGKTDPDGSATFKVEIPHEISATTEPEYGFVRWAAFPTSFLATGDNQAKNKDVYFIDNDDYNTRLLPHEIQAPVVVFEDAKSASTKVTINEKRDDIFLVPIVAQRPAVSLTIPAKGSSGVVRNMSVRINFTKPMDPESFKNEAGEYDKITITQGIQTFSADGDIEINSQDITDRFEAPVFSTNQKMVTLRFTQEAIEEGYASQSSVNIIISKDVKDIFGFNMTDDDKISFSVGSSMDTLAPRITFLTAGTDLTNFDSFKGMYKDSVTWGNITAFTKMEPHQQGSGQNATYLGAKDAPANNLDSSFYDTFAPPADASNSGYRVTNKLYIHALAEDIAGSGSNQSQTGLETDVAMLGIRATLMYQADGTVPAEAVTAPTTSVNYMPQSVGPSLAKDYVYKNLVHAINVKNGTPNASDEGYIAEDKGFLFEYDLSSLPDGLIRVDVFAVDMVQNSGLAAGGELSEEYGNGYASLFIVKDTTPPDAAANSGYVIVDTGADSHITADNYFNEVTYSRVKIKADTSSITDSGHPRLRAHHDNIKWVVKPTSGTEWVSSIKTTDSSWGAVTSNYGPFPNPGNEGKVFYTYALMDDVGNISNAVGINPIYYDSVAPEVQTPYFVADAGYTAGVAKDNILDEQTLVLPIKEITSGLKSIEVRVRKNGATDDYATPLADSSLVVKAGGEDIPYTIDSAKKTITFNQPVTDFDSNVTIKGLKLSDNNDEQGSFEIKVLVKDAAAADSVHETIPAVGAVSNTDSIPVHINTIYIPNIRKTERMGGTGTEFWIDYSASTLTKRANSNPLTDVYITFTEATSGAKIFDFTGSSITLTDDSNGNGSKIYKVNASNGTIDGIAIPSTVSGNKLTITSSVDAKDKFANPNGDNKITVKITNVALAAEGTDSEVSLKIYDTATNESTAGTTICSNEGSLNLITPGISTPDFKFDSTNPTSAMTHGNLVDRDSTESYSTATEATGKTAAETGYTNETLINATVTLNPKASGISSLRIDGDATFVSGTTTIKANGTDIDFDISSAGKVVTFKNANGHLVLGSGTTAITLTISNLKLTTGDGEKSVNFLARSFGNVEDPIGSTDTIILDTVPPTWVDNGLYSAYNSSVSTTTAYPHPVSGGKVYGLSGVDTANPNDLYFYRYSRISIMPDVSDSGNNLKAAASLIDYTHDGVAVTNNNAAYSPDSSYGYTTQTGSFTATAKDKAGNKSTVKTFHIVADTEFAADTECNALYNYMTLYKPDGSFIHRNTPNEYGIYYYVIKKDDYQIRVKLGGNAPEAGEEAVAGGTPSYTSGTPYIRKENTKTSSKIEKYYVARSDSSTPGITSSYWKSYTPGAANTFDDIITSVDINGTIIIKLPQESSSPIKLYLLDACGNSYSMLTRVTSTDTHGIEWNVDNEVASSGENLTGTPEIYSGTYTDHSDVSFYNAPVTLKIYDLTESCRFPTGAENTPSFPSYSTDSSFTYTMKSRIIAWTESGTPGRDCFGNNDGTTYKAGITPPPASSDWCFVKQANSGNYPVFYVQNNFPQFASTARYKLFVILEDTVGNYEIRQIRRASNGSLIVSKTDPSSTDRQYWLYDNTAPDVDTDSIAFHKVNQVTVNGELRNYYSGNSTVTYNITDSGSGIYHDGSGTTTYPGFASRRTAITPKTYTIPQVSAGGTPSLSGIKDYAGNTRTAITLTNGSSSKWYYRNTAPVLAGTTSTNKAWAETTSVFGYVTPTLASDSETEGQVLSLKAKSSALSLDVYLSVTDTEELLGWKISPTKLSITGNECYTAADVTQLSYDSTKKRYTYSYVKAGTLNYVSWTDASAGITQTQYFYPVNRAGLVGKPIKVMFVENVRPAITNGDNNNGYTYSSNASINSTYCASDAPETAYTIKAGTGTPKINYTRNGATVTFTTTQAPTAYKFVFGAGDNGRWGDDDDDAGTLTELSGSGPTYTIPLDSAELQSRTSSASGTPLRIQLSRGTEEDSVVYELNGPAGNNLWVYDNTTPSISFTASFTSSSDLKSGSSTGAAPANSVVSTDDTMYIQNANAFIKFTLEDVSFAGANDIAHFQYKKRTDFTSDTAWSGWTDITSGRDGGNLTFAAPAEKTEYMFRAIDTAGNISAATTAVKLQRDDEAPDGTFAYETRKGTVASSTSADKKDLTDTGLGAGNGVDNPYGGNADVRDISYSASPDSPYYLTHIWVDLSKITDKYTSANVANPSTGIERSGIQNFIIKKDGTTLSDGTLGPDAGSYRIDLTNNGSSTVVYEVWAIDNINQERKLKTFRTTVDSTAPVLSDLAIQAKDASGNNASDAVLYPDNATGVYYIKNTKAHITFNIDDAFATYEWSTTGGDSESEWHDSNHTEVEASSTSITWTFDAPDSVTTYYFRGTDRVKNTSTPVSFKLQKDMWAPAVPATENGGLIKYSLYNGDSEITSLTESDGTTSLITGADTASVEIKYSSNASGNSSNYINKIIIDLSKVTDNVTAAGTASATGIARSDIKTFLISKDGGTTYANIGSFANVSSNNCTWDGSEKKLTITITNGSNEEKSYYFKAEDNAGNAQVLRTFTLKPNADLPNFALATGDGVVQTSANADGSEAVNGTAKSVTGATDNGTYYLNKVYTVINFTNTKTDGLTYWVSTNGGTYSKITSGLTDNSATSGTVSYVFETPTASTSYKFKAKDEVLNESSETTAITIQKDTNIAALSINDWNFKKGTGTDTIGTTYFNITNDGTASKSITYNGNQINKFEYDFTSYASSANTTEISGIRRYWLKVGENDEVDSLTATSPAISGTKWPVGIAETGTDEQVIKLRAEDWAGNFTSYVEYKLAPDSVAPALALDYVAAQGDGDEYVVSKYPDSTAGVYYLKYNNAVVKFTTTTPDDIAKYTMGGSEITLTDTTNLKYKWDTSTITTATEYSFKSVDAVGNESTAVTIKLCQDQTPPTGSVTYTVNKDSTAAQVVDASHIVGDYKVSVSGTTTTITYNPANVNNIVFTPSITDEGSGYDALYRRASGIDTVIESDTIALTDSMNGETYVLIAKDHAGNTLALGTYVFTADSTGPALDSSKVTVDSNVNMAHGYTTASSIPYVTVKKIGSKQKANLCTDGTKINYAKTLIPDAVKYQFVKTVTTDSSDGYNANAAADSWLPMDDGTTDNTGTDFIFALPEVHAHHTRLALFFMDSLGNASAPYYIGNNGGGQNDYGIQWWLTTPELTTENVKVSNVTLLNDSNTVGWQGQKDYLVSIKLPKNAVIHSIALSPDSDGNNGVVYALGSDQSVKDQIHFTGYDLTNNKVDKLETACINLAESTEVGLQLKIYVWDKKKDGGAIGKSDPKITINGNIELTVFPEGDNPYSGSVGAVGAGLPGISSIGTGTDSGEETGSRVAQLFNSVANVFARNSEVTVDNSVTEKPAEAAKKAAKKAKKTSKKAKKTAKQVVSTSSTTAMPDSTTAMSVEAAEIVEQTVTSEVPEITTTTETVVNEIAALTEKVKGESEAITTIEPVAETASESPVTEAEELQKRSPSRSASIVIMIAILSSLSAVWYFQRSRK